MSKEKMEGIQQYDRIITDRMIRAMYGSDPFYNVGLWSEGVDNPSQASKALVEHLLAGIENPRDILDVGCGLGATSHELKLRWPEARVTGVNISPYQVDLCNSNIPDVDFRVMDATSLSFPDESFDLVMSVEAAFHFDTRKEFLREAMRVLRPGGVLTVSDMLVHKGPMAQAITIWDVVEENHVESIPSYIELLSDTGFVDCRIDDITSDSWLAWLHAVEHWIDANRHHPEVTDEQRRNWQQSLPFLRESVRHYITAFAVKPAS